MKFYDTIFFADKDTGFYVHIRPDIKTLRLNSSATSDYIANDVTIHFDNTRQLINFKNSVIAAFDKYIKEVHGA